MTDREAARMQTRIRIFERRGHAPSEAEALANRLLERDQDLDERRMCVECRHLNRRLQCSVIHVAMAWSDKAPIDCITTQLHRCARFDWQTQ